MTTPIVREVLTLSLQDAGYAVLTADSGAAALACAGGRRARGHHRLRPDDAGDGRAGVDPSGAESGGPNLPAVLLTGYAGDGAALAVGGAISGTFSLLRKPVSGAQLARRVSALLGSPEARQETA